jgi:FkbM family methyltransferase
VVKPYRRVAERLRSGKDCLHLARLLQALGASPMARAKIVVATCLMPLKRRVPRFAQRWIRLDIAYGGRRLGWHVSDASELIALADILCHEQYRLPNRLSPRTIVDLGSNIGGSVLYFACRYPAARIYGVEPDPTTFQKLQANVAPLENVEVLSLAVGDRDGDAEFFPNPHTWASSLKSTFATGPGITVPVRTLDTLLDEIGLDQVDLVKLDIEGSEHDVLRAFHGLPTRAGALIGEMHGFLPEVYAATERFLEGVEGFEITYDREGGDHLFLAVATAATAAAGAKAPGSADER